MSVEEEHAYTNCIIYVFNYVNRGTQNRNRSQIKEKKMYERNSDETS